MKVERDRLTKVQLKEAIGMDMREVFNSRFKRRLSLEYGGFFRPLSKKEERSERNKLKKEITTSSNKD